ncbi:DUF397 domain-containing protein [Kitasatospora sp. NBC_00374]|uniref:DUF397 domain-containing protein n=1 Tax=Kitasatospora sp. NBC_00374 TaxID=2975964 RepID=UPI0030E2568C
MSSTQWFKSSYGDNAGNGDCVRVSFTHLATDHTVLIGDTKTPDTHLTVHPAAWSAFVTAAATGEFDFPPPDSTVPGPHGEGGPGTVCSVHQAMRSSTIGLGVKTVPSGEMVMPPASASMA